MNLGRHTVHDGDCVAWLRTLPDASVDAVVTDPPYGLGFMGRKWDALPPGPEVFAELLRVAKPGAHLVSFGGTRTYHRMAVAAEDAGWEIRDMVAWLYGQGFPKSHAVGKAIDRAAGAEREVIGRTERKVGPPGTRRVEGLCGTSTFRENPSNPGNLLTAPATPEAARWEGWGTALKPAHEPAVLARKPLSGTVAANVLEHGCGGLNVDGCRVPVEHDGRPLRTRTTARPAVNAYGDGISGSRAAGTTTVGRWPANVVHDGSHDAVAPLGEASRFFYCAKVRSRERAGTRHPTVKPLDLMRYFVRLVTPPGGVVLDPFLGSGTTLLAAEVEGVTCWGAEREHVPDIVQRWERRADFLPAPTLLPEAS